MRPAFIRQMEHGRCELQGASGDKRKGGWVDFGGRGSRSLMKRCERSIEMTRIWVKIM